MTELGWVEKTAFLHQERRLMELYAEGRLAMEDYMDFSLAPIAGRTRRRSPAPSRISSRGSLRIHADAVRLLIISARRTSWSAPSAAGWGWTRCWRSTSRSDGSGYRAHPRHLTYREVRRLDAWLAQEGRRWPARPSIPTRARPAAALAGRPAAHGEPDPALLGHAREAGWPCCNGAEKALRLPPAARKHYPSPRSPQLAQEGETLAGATFYSDSRNDLPLLSRVDWPHTVNPDPALLGHAREAGLAGAAMALRRRAALPPAARKHYPVPQPQRRSVDMRDEPSRPLTVIYQSLREQIERGLLARGSCPANGS